MPQLSCPGCHASLTIESLQDIPAWCSKCGHDLPRNPEDLFNDPWGNSPAPTVAESAPPVPSFEAAFSDSEPQSTPEEPPAKVAQQVQDVLASAGLSNVAPQTQARENPIAGDERFSKHNLVVGLLLAFWGIGASLFLGAGGGSGIDSIDSTADFLQHMMVLSGVALFVSGLGIREGEKWGYQLAQVCAGFQILAGLFFLVTWQRLRGASVEVEESVAVLSFVQVNLDLLIGLVDGAGLSLFLYQLRLKQMTRRDDQQDKQRLATLFQEQA